MRPKETTNTRTRTETKVYGRVPSLSITEHTYKLCHCYAATSPRSLLTFYHEHLQRPHRTEIILTPTPLAQEPTFEDYNKIPGPCWRGPRRAPVPAHVTEHMVLRAGAEGARAPASS